jgi:hypothetical protein
MSREQLATMLDELIVLAKSEAEAWERDTSSEARKAAEKVQACRQRIIQQVQPTVTVPATAG